MYKFLICFLSLFLCACKDTSGEMGFLMQSPVYPEYEDVTIPPNIAPLSFIVNTTEKDVKTVLQTADYQVTVNNKQVTIPVRKWKKLAQPGSTIRVDISVKKDAEWKPFYAFSIYVAQDKIDPYLTYRLIAPGYEVWNFMGIYQRCLSSYAESPIYENNTTNHHCINCHTTNQGNPEEFIFHQRPKPSGTILVKDGVVTKLDTHYNDEISSLVYPSWHPSGNYIAFSVNKTVQSIHSTDPNRIEVWDLQSDIVILDVRSNTLITTPLLMSEQSLETYPSFSPDGKTLYFCSANMKTLPDSVLNLQYDICSIEINPDTKIFGKIDTLIHAAANNHSTSFPRISPDGRFLLYTHHKYGSFSIWHQDAELRMFDLKKKTLVDVAILNSPESESYHSWSSNGRWIVFSSRRGDGLYTRPYFAHINENGTVAKPFLLPQKNGDFYFEQDRSYNIPEFMKGKIKGKQVQIERLLLP